jgi:hypothetical protein
MRNSAELRWFFRKPPAGLKEWFVDQGNFTCAAGGGQKRKDRYVIVPDQVEMGIKKRGEQHEDENGDVEIKGLVSVGEAIDEGSFQGTVQIWTKWKVPTLSLKNLPTLLVTKSRWLRKFKIEDTRLTQVPLDEKEDPIEGAFPEEGCNLEYTEIELESKEGADEWCTLGFESFGPLERVVHHLQITTHHVAHRHAPPSDFSSALEMSYPMWLARLGASFQDEETGVIELPLLEAEDAESGN